MAGGDLIKVLYLFVLEDTQNHLGQEAIKPIDQIAHNNEREQCFHLQLNPSFPGNLEAGFTVSIFIPASATTVQFQ